MKSENEMEIVQIQDDALGKLLSHISKCEIIFHFSFILSYKDTLCERIYKESLLVFCVRLQENLIRGFLFSSLF